MSETGEVPGEGVRCLPVVQVDREHVIHRLGFDCHQGDPALAKDRHLLGEAGAAPDQHHGIHRGIADARGTLAVLGEQQEAGPEGSGLVGDSVQHRDVHRVTEGVTQAILDHHPDDAGASAAQGLGARIRPGVVELGCGGQHARAGGGRDRP